MTLTAVINPVVPLNLLFPPQRVICPQSRQSEKYRIVTHNFTNDDLTNGKSPSYNIGFKERSIQGLIWITRYYNRCLLTFNNNLKKYWYANTSRIHVLIQNLRWRKIQFQFHSEWQKIKYWKTQRPGKHYGAWICSSRKMGYSTMTFSDMRVRKWDNTLINVQGKWEWYYPIHT